MSGTTPPNRAVALGMAYGPQAGLALLDQIADAPAMPGDLLERIGRPDEARAEFERAAGLTRNDRERRLLLDRARRLAPPLP